MSNNNGNDRRLTETPLRRTLHAYRLKHHTRQDADLMAENMEHLSRMPEESVKEIFEKSLSELKSTIRTSQPEDLLASISTYFLTNIGKQDDTLNDEGEINQAHVEFLQALALTIPRADYSFSGIGEGPRIDRVSRQLPEVFIAHSIQRQKKYTTLTDNQEALHEIVLDHLRLPTQYLRNWGFPDQMKRILIELFGPLDSDFADLHGVRATSLIAMLHGIVGLVEQRLDDHFANLANAFAGRSGIDIVRGYYEAFPDMAGAAEDVLDFIDEHDIDEDSVRVMILEHSSLRFRDVYTFSVDDLQGCTPDSTDYGALLNVLNTWSLSFGDLSTFPVEYLFLDNPVWTKPFIRLSPERFFVPVAGSLVSFSTQLLDALISNEDDLKRKYERRRATFLEEAVASQMQRLFPPQRIHAGSKWYPPTYENAGENDVLVTLDEVALIVEAKSSQPTAEALRGGHLSSKTILRKLAVDATEQGHSFANALRLRRGVHRFSTDSGSTNLVDTTNLELFLFYNISFELLTLLNIRSRMLQEVGLLKAGFTLTPVATLAELELIVDVLQDGLQFLHYVQTRAKIESLYGLVADELDIFAYYLQGCPKIQELMSTPELGMVISGISKIVDVAVATEGDLSKTVWPRTKKTELISGLISDLRDRNEVGWVRIGLSLLSIPHREQESLEKNLNGLVRTVWKSRGPKCLRYKAFKIEEWDVSLIAILLASRGVDDYEEREFIKDLLEQYNRSVRPPHVVVIASNAAHRHMPYVLYHSPGYWRPHVAGS